jgi:hypothetical protein
VPRTVGYRFKLHDAFSSKAERIGRAATSMRVRIKSVGPAITKMSKRLKGASRGLQEFGSTMKWVSLGVGGFFGMALKTRATMEQLRISFDTMLGSAEKGRAFMDDILTFAARTPFQIEQVATAAKTLLAMGEPAASMTDTMTILGNISAGTGKNFRELAVIFGQIRAKGQLLGQDARQLQEAGVSITTEMASFYGTTTENMLALQAQGAITFEHVRASLARMTGKGGRFNEMMQRQSETLLGRWRNLTDEITIALSVVGRVVAEHLNLTVNLEKAAEAAKRFSLQAKVWADANPRLVKMGLILSGILIVLGPIALALGAIGLSIAGIAAAVALITAPMIGVSMIVAGIVALAAVFYVKWDAIFTWFSGKAQWISDKFEALKGYASMIPGFGGDGAVDVNHTGDLNQNSTTDINVNLAAPQGVVKSAVMKTKGRVAGLNTGLNMAEATP